MSTVIEPNTGATAPLINEATVAPPSGAIDPAEFAAKIQAKYYEEREKRTRSSKGLEQYVDVGADRQFARIAADPWVATEPPARDVREILEDKAVAKVIILGGGFAGLSAAVRLIDAGINIKDVHIVETGAGFGGTWYWNRYPGLMCDIESYIYMPLLEETGYMPKHKYAYGTELKEYIDLIVKKWNIRDSAIMQTTVTGIKWNDGEKAWDIGLTQARHGHDPVSLDVKAQMVFVAPGVLHHPQIPGLPGLNSYKGHSFHTSRWDYKYTGGSPSDWNMTGLREKRVGFIGTGATAIQAVPQLAKSAKELFVFQRTPSAVDVRGQRSTDENWWSKVVAEKGWQRRRNENFVACIQETDERPKDDMVDDGWTNMASYKALVGSAAKVSMEDLQKYIESLHASDLPRQERIRARVDSIVKESSTAEKLKAWYPGWCKRPCFHDDYLGTFNLPNVHLIDTDGQGIESVTQNGLVCGGKEYPLDLIIFGTGFRSPAVGTAAACANIAITGRGGEDLTFKNFDHMASLHGVVSYDFPNLFTLTLNQTGATAHYTWPLDEQAKHAAYMINQAEKKARGKRYLIEPKKEAEEAWTGEILQRCHKLAAITGCTPSYFNAEGAGDNASMEQKMKGARRSIWGDGYLRYLRLIEAWREKGDLEGLEITVLDD